MPKKLPSYHQLVTPKRVEASRPHSRARGYTRTWEKLRRMVLNREPWCRLCGTAAAVVDHIVPLSAGGSNKAHNLQALCKRCHDRKTYLTDGGLGHTPPSDHGQVGLGNRRPPQHFSGPGSDL